MAEINSEFWKNKRVFVTGHTGFKGGWLVLWLKKLGADVCGYSLPVDESQSLFHSAAVGAGVQNKFGDVRDYELLLNAMRAFEPDIVFHLAAQALVRQSYIDPIGTYSTNVMGTLHVLDAARKTETIRSVINVTSDKCYENNEWVWGYRENDPVGGSDPYSSSKGCSELLTTAFRRSYCDKTGFKVATARAGNVIGGGDWSKDRLVPDAIRAFSSGNTLYLRNPKSFRPWQHVLEPLSAYLILAENLFNDGGSFSTCWNFGPNSSGVVTTEELVKLIASKWQGSVRWEVGTSEQPHEAHSLNLDISKANLKLNWSPRWSLDTSVQHTTDWYKAFYKSADMNIITCEQIDTFQNS